MSILAPVLPTNLSQKPIDTTSDTPIIDKNPSTFETILGNERRNESDHYLTAKEIVNGEEPNELKYRNNDVAKNEADIILVNTKQKTEQYADNKSYLYDYDLKTTTQTTTTTTDDIFKRNYLTSRSSDNNNIVSSSDTKTQCLITNAVDHSNVYISGIVTSPPAIDTSIDTAIILPLSTAEIKTTTSSTEFTTISSASPLPTATETIIGSIINESSSTIETVTKTELSEIDAPSAPIDNLHTAETKYDTENIYYIKTTTFHYNGIEDNEHFHTKTPTHGTELSTLNVDKTDTNRIYRKDISPLKCKTVSANKTDDDDDDIEREISIKLRRTRFYQTEFLSLSLSPPLNRRRDMPALRGPFVSL